MRSKFPRSYNVQRIDTGNVISPVSERLRRGLRKEVEDPGSSVRLDVNLLEIRKAGLSRKSRRYVTVN